MLVVDKRTVEAVATESVSVDSVALNRSRFVFVMAVDATTVGVVDVLIEGDVYSFLSTAALTIPVEVELEDDDD